MESLPLIINSTAEDTETIFEFYDIAVAHQKTVFNKHWQGFSPELVAREISENRQYKIIIRGRIAGIFAVTFNDPQIWEERDLEPSIYIHRIVTHPDFRGYGIVKIIVNWAIEYCKENGLQYVRVDTWADNERLFDHYTSCGFVHTGVIAISPESGLPKHYHGISLNLFEIAVR